MFDILSNWFNNIWFFWSCSVTASVIRELDMHSLVQQGLLRNRRSVLMAIFGSSVCTSYLHNQEIHMYYREKGQWHRAVSYSTGQIIYSRSTSMIFIRELLLIMDMQQFRGHELITGIFSSASFRVKFSNFRKSLQLQRRRVHNNWIRQPWSKYSI